MRSYPARLWRGDLLENFLGLRRAIGRPLSVVSPPLFLVRGSSRASSLRQEKVQSQRLRETLAHSDAQFSTCESGIAFKSPSLVMTVQLPRANAIVDSGMVQS